MQETASSLRQLNNSVYILYLSQYSLSQVPLAYDHQIFPLIRAPVPFDYKHLGRGNSTRALAVDCSFSLDWTPPKDSREREGACALCTRMLHLSVLSFVYFSQSGTGTPPAFSFPFLPCLLLFFLVPARSSYFHLGTYASPSTIANTFHNPDELLLKGPFLFLCPVTKVSQTEGPTAFPSFPTAPFTC